MDDNQQDDQAKGRGPDYIAYTVRDGGPGKDASWNRVGAGWEHRDGRGVDLSLSSLPVDGRISLREARKEAFKEQRREGQAHGQTRQHNQSRDQGYDR